MITPKEYPYPMCETCKELGNWKISKSEPCCGCYPMGYKERIRRKRQRFTVEILTHRDLSEKELTASMDRLFKFKAVTVRKIGGK